MSKCRTGIRRSSYRGRLEAYSMPAYVVGGWNVCLVWVMSTAPSRWRRRTRPTATVDVRSEVWVTWPDHVTSSVQRLVNIIGPLSHTSAANDTAVVYARQATVIGQLFRHLPPQVCIVNRASSFSINMIMIWLCLCENDQRQRQRHITLI